MTTGEFSGFTKAIMEFQAMARLRVDGIFGPVTRGALRANARGAMELRRAMTLRGATWIGDRPQLLVDVRTLFRSSRAPRALLRGIALLESGPGYSGISSWTTHVNALATSSTGYVGVGQLGVAAMDDVIRHGLYHGATTRVVRKGREFLVPTDWYDPIVNSAIMDGYVMLLLRRNSDWGMVYATYVLGSAPSHQALRANRAESMQDVAHRMAKAIKVTERWV